jgi:predicted RNase H-like HicB family nuclease
MTYKVALHQSKEGFAVSRPGLPGCWSQGKTGEEALQNVKDGIQEYLEAVRESLQGADIREIEIAV